MVNTFSVGREPLKIYRKGTYFFGTLNGSGFKEIFFESFVISNNSVSIHIVLLLFSKSSVTLICNSSSWFICSHAFSHISVSIFFKFSKVCCS